MKTLNSLEMTKVIREQDWQLQGRWADLSGCSLSSVDFTGATLTNAVLPSADGETPAVLEGDE